MVNATMLLLFGVMMWSYRFLDTEEKKEEEKVEKVEEKPKIVEVVKREGKVLSEVVAVEQPKKERKHLFKKKEKVEKTEDLAASVVTEADADVVEAEDVLEEKE